ncbi:MAG: gliding motility protein GldL [Muribaculaceae bacterium]|nr:gliding motility protein GldL [Muribaculaceae bacterium]
MGKIKQYRNVISRFISSENGQRFFNFAYSIGAAIVIWGALFKILHLPGGNTLLSIGMGTEVLMFILTAFDRPPKEYHWERVYPGLFNGDEEPAAEIDAEDQEHAAVTGNAQGGATVVISGGTPLTGGGIVVAGGGVAPAASASAPGVAVSGTMAGVTGAAGPSVQPTGDLAGEMDAFSLEMQQLRDTTRRLNEVSSTLLESYRAITENSDNISANSNGYVEQMQALNRNIQGLNTIYEIQLKSVSSQLDAIDRVNRGIKEISDMYMNTANNSSRYCEETEKMALNMQRLNRVYEKMLTAMTINMYPGMAASAAAAAPATNPDQAESNDQK